MKHLSEMDLIEMATGRMPPAQRQACESHIARCPECRSRRQAGDRLWRQLEVIEVPRSEFDAEDLVQRALQQAASPATLGWRALVPHVFRVAAAVALAAGAGHLAGRMTWQTTEVGPRTVAEQLYLNEVFGHGASRLAGTMQQEIQPNRAETNG